MPNGPILQQSKDCGNKPCEDEDDEEVREDTNHLENSNEDYDYGERADGTGEVIEEWLQVRGIRIKCSDAGASFPTSRFNEADMRDLRGVLLNLRER